MKSGIVFLLLNLVHDILKKLHAKDLRKCMRGEKIGSSGVSYLKKCLKLFCHTPIKDSDLFY